MARKKVFRVEKEIKAIARERVGRVPPSATIEPKKKRKKPKHKRPPGEETE